MTSSTTPNHANELHHYYMWSLDNLAELLDCSRSKAKQFVLGEKQPNQLQHVLLKEVAKRQLTQKRFSTEARRVYRLKLIRESEDE